MAKKTQRKADIIKSSLGKAGRIQRETFEKGAEFAGGPVKAGIARVKSIVPRRKLSEARRAGAKRALTLIARARDLARKIWADPVMQEYAEKQAKLIKETLDKAEIKIKKKVNW